MPICPTCKKDTHLKKGACAICGQALAVYNGMYYRDDLGSPTIALLEKFEHMVSVQTSKKQGASIVFRVPRKSGLYKRELVEAQRLLDLCGGDYDLAEITLQVLFENKQFAFKTRTTLIGLGRDFVLAQAVAEHIMEMARKKSALEESVFEKLEAREDVWA